MSFRDWLRRLTEQQTYIPAEAWEDPTPLPELSSRVLTRYHLTEEVTVFELSEPQVRHVAHDNLESSLPSVFIEHDPEAPPTMIFALHIVATDQRLPYGARYFGSARCGEFYWHVYGERR